MVKKSKKTQNVKKNVRSTNNQASTIPPGNKLPVPAYLDDRERNGLNQMVIGKIQGIPMPYDSGELGNFKISEEESITGASRKCFDNLLKAVTCKYNQLNPGVEILEVKFCRRADPSEAPSNHSLKVIAVFADELSEEDRMKAAFEGPNCLAEILHELASEHLEAANEIAIILATKETPILLAHNEVNISDGREIYPLTDQTSVASMLGILNNVKKLGALKLIAGFNNLALSDYAHISPPRSLENQNSYSDEIIYIKAIEDPKKNNNWVVIGEVYRKEYDDGVLVKAPIDERLIASGELESILSALRIDDVAKIKDLTILARTTKIWPAVHKQNATHITICIKEILDFKRPRGGPGNRFNL